jgi:hypothetical protein
MDSTIRALEHIYIFWPIHIFKNHSISYFRGKMYTKYSLPTCREVDYFRNLSVHGIIILKCVMKKQDSRMLTGFNNLEGH